MIDLSTQYLGLRLRTPLVASAGPLCKDVDNVCRLADAGVGAVVLQSLFEEQIDAESNQLDRMLSSGVETYEAQSYFPDMTSYNIGPDGYLENIRALKGSVHVPVIASLNGISLGGWRRLATSPTSATIPKLLACNLHDAVLTTGWGFSFQVPEKLPLILPRH